MSAPQPPTTISSIPASSNNAPLSSSSSSVVASAMGGGKPCQVKGYIWEFDMKQVHEWLLSTNALFPKSKCQTRLNNSNSNNNDTTISSHDSNIQNKDDADEEAKKIGKILLNNIIQALQSASGHQPFGNSLSNHNLQNNGNQDDNNLEPQTKRFKTESNNDTTTETKTIRKRDLYNILDSSFSKGEHILHQPGSILSRLSIGSLLNALAGVEGGIIPDTASFDIQYYSTLSSLKAISSPNPTDSFMNENNLLTSPWTSTTPIPSAQNFTLSKLLRTYATSLKRSIGAKLEIDMLDSTPTRIVEMLVPELSLADVNGIRKRVYDTVVLGKGTHSSLAAAALENVEDLPVAARVAVHDVDKFQKCTVCGNNDQSLFTLRSSEGDMICMECGTVAVESLMHEGSQFRKFEGEEDRNHNGDVHNPLFSNAHNMSTTLGGMSIVTGAGLGGYGSAGRSGRNMETVLRNAHSYIEMNISQMGKEEKKTRVGYKDRQKKDAFIQMNHAGDALNLHKAVVQRAKELFAGFRDDRELVQQFKGVVAACLCEAFDQYSREGKQLLRISTGEGDNGTSSVDVQQDPQSNESDDNHKVFPGQQNMHARAMRRSELHNSTLATKDGGLSLVLPEDTINAVNKSKNISQVSKNNVPKSPSSGSAIEKKNASSWDLDDTRSWLLEVSRSIARQWSERQKQDEKSDQSLNNNTTNTSASDITMGSLEEMEGRLAQHTFTICSKLEEEIKNSQDKNLAVMSGSRQRVVTPRVTDMGKLSIKWQTIKTNNQNGIQSKPTNKNGPSVSGEGIRGRSSKTAGQILILKTSKMLGDVLNDTISGDAFYKELRGLLARQEARRKMEMRDVASMNRLNQMKRKPWVQARLQL